MDSLAKIIRQCREDSVEYFGEEPSNNLTIFALGLGGETGEVLDEIKKMMRGSQTFEEAFPKIGEELVDVLIYVANIAGLLRIDLGAEYDRKRSINNSRFGGSTESAERVRTTS